MCTVTFIDHRTGYALGMNRDEKLTRVAAHAPARHQSGARAALHPSEPGGGTWIGVNDAGATLALINWYSVPARVSANALSRGKVVIAALAADSPSAAEQVLGRLPLARMNPFRFVGVFPGNGAVVEWRWDLDQLERVDHRWRSNTWISSGLDEPGAQQTRGKTFGEALRQPSAGSVEWLRRLHRSHQPERGPYSTCMHRPDAATVSYTEILVMRNTAIMRYAPGAPCAGLPATVRRLELDRSRAHWRTR